MTTLQHLFCRPSIMLLSRAPLTEISSSQVNNPRKLAARQQTYGKHRRLATVQASIWEFPVNEDKRIENSKQPANDSPSPDYMTSSPTGSKIWQSLLMTLPQSQSWRRLVQMTPQFSKASTWKARFREQTNSRKARTIQQPTSKA